jgi:PTS system ascorbate-specific IIC component
MSVINYLASNIFKQPSLFLGLVAALGLILQGERPTNVLKGTFKTIFGVIILFIGVNMLGSAVTPLSSAFGTLYQIPAANAFDPSICWTLLGDYGSQIGIVLVLSFAVNLVVARFTPIKNIFLTGHIFFWMSYLFVGVAVSLGLTGTAIIVFATFWLSAYIIITPALIRPAVARITGSDTFTIGHTASMYCLLGTAIGKVVGNKEKSTEKLNIPKQFDFLRETTITTALIMFIIYFVVGLLIGSESATAIYGASAGSIYTIGGAQYDLFSFSLMAGLTFGAGLTILLTGVRLMLGEIIPAFKGISDKLIPNAIPALDIPMIFPYAPNALMIGFIVSMFTSILTIVIMASTGTLAYAVIPLVIACFFDIAPAAVFANHEGGVTAAVITSALGGVLMVGLIILSLAMFKTTTAGFLQLYGGNGFSLWSIIAQFFGSLVF